MATVLTRTEPFDLFKDEVPGYPEGMKVHPDSYSDPYRQARKDGVEFKSIQDVAREMQGPTGEIQPLAGEEEG